jgi:hypothetical protein
LRQRAKGPRFLASTRSACIPAARMLAARQPVDRCVFRAVFPVGNPFCL